MKRSVTPARSRSDAPNRFTGSDAFAPNHDALHDPLHAAIVASADRHALRGARVCVAYSGGRDSTALLHALATERDRLGVTLSALHVHHGRSPDADAWVAHCEVTCNALDVPIQVERIAIDRRDPRGFEAAAREQRRALYQRCGADVVALAHHHDDQAETVLLQAMRGAGPAGLAAMAEWAVLDPHERDDVGTDRGAAAVPESSASRTDASRAASDAERSGASGHARVHLWRAWLDVTRAQIDAYLAARALRWVDDASNADPHHRRNLVRHTVLAPIAQAWPAAAGALARTARHAADAETLLRMLADEDLARLRDADGALPVAALAALPDVRAVNVLRVWCLRAGLAAPGRDALHEAWRQLRDARPGAAVVWRPRRDDARVLERFRGRLAWRPDATRSTPATARSGCAAVPGASADGPPADSVHPQVLLRNDGTCIVVRPAPRGGLAPDAWRAITFGAREGGERFRLRMHGARRPLKDWLREAGWSPAQRAQLPIARVDGEVAWVPGVGVADAFAARDGAAGLVLAWCSVTADVDAEIVPAAGAAAVATRGAAPTFR